MSILRKGHVALSSLRVKGPGYGYGRHFKSTIIALETVRRGESGKVSLEGSKLERTSPSVLLICILVMNTLMEVS